MKKIVTVFLIVYTILSAFAIEKFDNSERGATFIVWIILICLVIREYKKENN